ncbi:MAG: hypothetical protein ABSC34_04850 [Acidimicrobiales bacterium]
MNEDRFGTGRRLDHDLYAAEAVVVLGAAVFLVGFAIEGHSHTPGRALEALGFVIFGLGLFASAAVSYLLSRYFSRTFAEPVETFEKNPYDPPLARDLAGRPGMDRTSDGPVASEPLAPTPEAKGTSND